MQSSCWSLVSIPVSCEKKLALDDAAVPLNIVVAGLLDEEPEEEDMTMAKAKEA